MLKSQQMIRLAKQENDSFYKREKEIRKRTEELTVLIDEYKKRTIEVMEEAKVLQKEYNLLKCNHKTELETLERNYHIAIAMEKSECIKLQTEFDNIFPHSTLDFFEEMEIAEKLGAKNLRFMITMKCLESCGLRSDGCKYYSPRWR